MSMTGGRKRRGRRSARRHGKKGGMGCGSHSKKEKKGGMGCGSHKKKKTQKGGLSAVLATPSFCSTEVSDLQGPQARRRQPRLRARLSGQSAAQPADSKRMRSLSVC